VDDVSRYEMHLLGILAALIFGMWLFHFVHAWFRRKPARIRLKRMREGRRTTRDKL